MLTYYIKKKWEKHNNKILPNKYNFYPLRHRLQELLLKNKDKYNLKILESCGSLIAKQYVNESLSNLINESWITVCSSGRSDILMDKYLEVATSHSAILGNIPSDYAYLFKNNIIEVNEWMTDTEILEIIDNALKDKKQLQNMITKTAKIVDDNFSLKCAKNKMDNIFDKIENKRLYLNMTKYKSQHLFKS